MRSCELENLGIDAAEVFEESAVELCLLGVRLLSQKNTASDLKGDVR